MTVKTAIMALTAVCAAAITYGEGVAWKNLDAEHRKGGRKVSAGYLVGKVVMVCRDASASARMEEVWNGFKTKPFVMLGAFDGKADDVTYPVYAGAGLAENEPTGHFYLVGATGKVLFSGSDERLCEENVVGAIADIESPKDLAAWKETLEFERKNLPARATLRLAEFKKKFPKEAKYAAEVSKELSAIADAKKVSELVSVARKLKDMKVVSPKKAKAQKAKAASSIDSALAKYAALKDVADARLTQEAKNALADLTWAKADL